MAPKNPYLNKKGLFMEARWLSDAQGSSKLDKRFINYATSQGYEIRSDRDATALPGTAYNSGPNGRVGTFQWAKDGINSKGGSNLYPAVALYKTGAGTGGAAGGQSGSDSSSGKSMEQTIADLLGDIGGEMASYAAGNQNLIQQVAKSNNKLIKQIAKKGDTTKLLQGELATARDDLTSMTSRFEDRFTQQQDSFEARLVALQTASSEAQNNFQRLLALSQQRLDEAQGQFQTQMSQAEANRLAMQADYEKQLQQTRALANAYVPQMEQTAVAPKLGDERTTEQARRPRNLQSVSTLSIAMPSNLQIA